MRANLSLGDSLAGLQAALGILLALRARDADPARRGQVVDVAIYESVFAVLESVVPEFDRLGRVRGPSGTTITGIVPSNAYPCADGRAVVVGANNSANFRRLMEVCGRADLAADPVLARQPRPRRAPGGDRRRDRGLDADPRRRRGRAPARARVGAGVDRSSPSPTPSPTRSTPRAARIARIDDGGRPLAVPAVGPKLSATPARSRARRARARRRHARGPLRATRVSSDAAIDALAAAGVVAAPAGSLTPTRLPPGAVVGPGELRPP